MGLDQTLYKTIWLSEYNETMKDKTKIIQDLFDENADGKVQEIKFEIGYWRKANAIHKWFVNNVQDGEDDCGSYEVEIEQLIELKRLCEEVLADHKLADELLPTTEGCFFGGTEYDEWYFQALEQTIEIMNKIVPKEILNKLQGDEKWGFATYKYSSSW